MNLSEPEIRHPTRGAINSLALRFSLPNHDGMQDWEYEVADYRRIDEFLEVYKSDSTSEDESFVLLEMLFQSFEDSTIDLRNSEKWSELLKIADKRFNVHIYTLWYWSRFESNKEDEIFRISPFVRNIYARNV